MIFRKCKKATKCPQKTGEGIGRSIAICVAMNCSILNLAIVSTALSLAACQGIIEGGGELTGENADGYRIGNFPGPDGLIRAPYVREGDTAIVGGDIHWRINSTLSIGAAAGPFTRWPGGIIPYRDSENIAALQIGVDAWNAVSEQTGITFVERTTQTNYLDVIPGRGCYSYLGFVGGAQQLSLGQGCYGAAAIHELGHAIGMMHEHTRAGRERYVRFNWDNIVGGKESRFAKVNLGITQGATNYSEYDFTSIMHYRNVNIGYQYLIDPSIPLFVVVGDEEKEIDNTTLSQSDISGATAMYEGFGGQKPDDTDLVSCSDGVCSDYGIEEGECTVLGTGSFHCKDSCLEVVANCGEDGSDSNPTFSCNNGEKIPLTYLCDNYYDCSDFSDEGEVCGVDTGGDESTACQVGQDVGVCIDTSTTICYGELYPGVCPSGAESHCCL